MRQLSSPADPTATTVVNSPWGPLRAWYSDAGLHALYFHNVCLPKRWAPPPQVPEVSAPWGWAELVARARLAPPGTPWQRRVWSALLQTTPGVVLSYGELAARMGRPSSVRAVASAVASNPIGVLIPCHRIVPAKGGVGQYRWGSSLKADLIAYERSSGAR